MRISRQPYFGLLTATIRTTKFFSNQQIVLLCSSDMNAGVGTSALGFGALQANGPFRVDQTGEALVSNPYSWNKGKFIGHRLLSRVGVLNESSN